MPKATKKKKEKAADFSVRDISKIMCRTPSLMGGLTESQAQAW
jgi:hypothetical protein